MRILFDNPAVNKPLASFVLLDWSCRESFHIFKYLSQQTVPREQFEIIWLEYYDRVAPEVGAEIKSGEMAGRPPMVDQWIVLDIPKHVYYHKHLMYNVGIVAARGKIVTVCDADVMVRPTFVESIIHAFERNDGDPGVVLHLDEVRNIDKSFYPFNYPSFEAVAGERCINWKNGKTTGLLDQHDRLHTLNYGACMAALRDDLVAIGGADEHIDYLGHICGPYEMTFRLVNAGRKEVWHEEEFLYHTWHPGTDGKKNYLGPHDGRQVSSTALQGFYSGRVLPLVENPAIKSLRLEEPCERESLLEKALSGRDWEKWDSEKIGFGSPPVFAKLVFIKMFVRSFCAQVRRFLDKPKNIRDIFRGVFISSFVYLGNSIRANSQLAIKCEKCLDDFAATGVSEFAIFGVGDLADTLYDLSAKKNIRVNAVYDFLAGRTFHGFMVLPLEELKKCQVKVVLGTLDRIAERAAKLKAMGIGADRIIVLM